MTMVGAQAADLPSKKAAPATYVKICDAYGAGFFFIPGTDTCIKIGGRVRYDLGYAPKGDYYGNATSTVTYAESADAVTGAAWSATSAATLTKAAVNAGAGSKTAPTAPAASTDNGKKSAIPHPRCLQLWRVPFCWRRPIMAAPCGIGSRRRADRQIVTLQGAAPPQPHAPVPRLHPPGFPGLSLIWRRCVPVAPTPEPRKAQH